MTAADTTTAPRWAEGCRGAGLVGIVSIAVMRTAIVVAPQTVFDVDPARFPGHLSGVGPAGSLWLDVALLAACVLGLVGESHAGRRLDWRLLVLAALPLPLILWQGSGDLDDLRRGSTWAAAAFAAAVVAHLARDRRLRRVAMIVLAAAVAPLLVRGVMQITIEHADTVAAYEANREAFLEQQGWAPDSAAARIYERRLRQPQPNGWFVTSNVYASALVYAAILWVAAIAAAVRNRLTSGWIALAVLVAAAPLGLLAFTGSKGAFLALGAGLLVLGLAFLPERWRERRAGLAPWVLLALIGGALLAVVVRGAVLPEGFAGDRSLLFRWHYLVGSARIVAESPLTGVGADGFQVAYTQVRPPRSPEEVASAHSMFADWLTALGVLGLSWVAMTVVFVWRAGCRARRASEPAVETGPAERLPLVPLVPLVTLVAPVVALLVALLIEWPTDPVALFARVLGVLLFAALLGVARYLYGPRRSPLVAWSFTAAAVALLVHGQIEMTFHQEAAVAWAMIAVAMAGRARDSAAGADDRSALGGTVVATAVAAAALWLVIAGAWPATAMERRMSAAAEILRPIGESRAALQMARGETDRMVAAGHLARAARGLEQLGIDEKQLAVLGLAPWALEGGNLPPDVALRIERLIRGVEPARRDAAAEDLLRAYDAMPTSGRTLEAAAEQLRLAALGSEPDAARARLRRAREIVHQAIEFHGEPSAFSLAIGIEQQIAAMQPEHPFYGQATAFARRLTAIDPHGISTWRRLGDLHWAAGERREALRAYRRALENDRNFELDPLKQLSDAERTRLQDRIKGGFAP